MYRKDLLQIILEHSSQFFLSIISFFIAFLMSFFRIIYLQREDRMIKKVSECVICGMLSATSGAVFEWLNLPINLVLPFSAIVGFLGVDYVRKLSIKYFYKK